MLYPTYKPVINWRNDANLSNLYSIHLRITLRGVRKYIAIPLPQKVALDQWTDKPNAWVKNTHPFAFEINNAITAKVTVLDDLVKRYYNSKKNLDFPTILRELGKNYNTHSFNKYFDAYNKAPREKVVDDTLNKYRTCLKWLDKFNPNITFNDLSDTLFQDFKKYLETEAKLEPSTLLSYFSAIKKVVYWARKDNHITKDRQETIFEDVHIKVGKKPSEHLEVHHIIALRDFDFSTKRQSYENSRDRDLFLLLVYTGPYYSDLKDLQKLDVKLDPEYGPYIWAGRFKNDNLSIIPLWKFSHAIELFDKYKSENPKDRFVIDRKYLIEDQAFNRNLKVIAKHLEWDFNLYNKMGRTTNAQLYIRFGASRPTVSKMLGHEKESTTETYFTINLADVIEGTKGVDFKKIGL